MADPDRRRGERRHGDRRDDCPRAERRQYPVTSDEPVSLVRPRRAAKVTAWAFAFAIVACSAAGSYVSTVVAHERGSAHTDRRIATLEKDLSTRRAAAAEGNARRDQQLRETEQIICTVMNRIVPRDAEVEAVRARFRCDGQVSPSVSPSRPS